MNGTIDEIANGAVNGKLNQAVNRSVKGAMSEIANGTATGMMDPNFDIKYTQLFINNEFRDACSGKTYPILDPSDGSVICEISRGEEADIELAVEAAGEAFKCDSLWRKMDPARRGVLIDQLADEMEANKEYLAKLLVANVGKTVKLSRIEVDKSIETLRSVAGWADKVRGHTIPIGDKFMSYTIQEPIGVCGIIHAWNIPLLLFALKVGSALATGNTVVLKPAEEVPLVSLFMASLIRKLGFPPGVVNVVPGFGPTAGRALASHRDVDKIDLCASWNTAVEVTGLTGKSNLKKTSVLTTGKSPLVVCSDVDIDHAVNLAQQSAFFNSGQMCIAGSRTYVHESIYDEFVAKSIERAAKIKIGNPWDESTDMGPLATAEQVESHVNYVKLAREEGARVVFGGNRIESKGYYVEPAIIIDIEEDMSVFRKTTFYPVQLIFKFKTLDEAIQKSNHTDFRLAAGILTKDINNALKFTRNVCAATVWVNNFLKYAPQVPFGGHKAAGNGALGGEHTISEYTKTKSVFIKIES